MTTDDHQMELVPHSYQGSLIQQRAADGYINATAMCKAAGKLWADYNRLSATQAFLAALSADMGIPISHIVQAIRAAIHPSRALG